MQQRAPDQEERGSARQAETATNQSVGFVRRVLIIVGLVALTVLLASIIWYSSDVLLLAFAGVLLAVALRGLSDWVSAHTRLSSGWSLALVSLALLVLLGLGVTLFAAGLVQQARTLAEQVPQALEQFRQQLEQIPGGQQLLAQAQGGGQGNMLGSITTLFSTSLGALANIGIILFLGVYFAADPKLYISGLLHLLPKPRRQRASEVLHTLGYTLRWWLLGQLLSMTVVGILTGLGLLLLGVPLAPLLGLLAGLLDFVPTVGPVIAAVPGVLLAFTEGSTTGFLAVGLYMVVQILEGYVLYPLIQERAVKLPPALTILALALMGVLLGGLGLLLATPLLAVVLTLVKMLYVQDVLDDPIDVPGAPESDA